MAENALTRLGDKVATGIKDFHVGRYKLDHHPATTHLMQALARGKIDVDDARSLLEHAPRFTHHLCEGLVPMFGKVTPGYFVELARGGYLTLSVIERAMR